MANKIQRTKLRKPSRGGCNCPSFLRVDEFNEFPSH